MPGLCVRIKKQEFSAHLVEIFSSDNGDITLTKREIVQQIAAELGVDQLLTKKIVQKCLDSIIETLVESGRIELRNFGVFEVKHRAARKARNPKTNQEVFVPARKMIAFQAGKNVAALFQNAPAQAQDDENPAQAAILR
jgi:nucleoid DNA-binding protein